MNIKESVILITSAGTNLGSTLAAHFIALGAKVIAIDTNSKQLDTMCFNCPKNSDNLLVYPIEDYSEESINCLFAKLKDDLQITIDVLINYWPSSPLPTLTSEQNAEVFSKQLSSLVSPMFRFGQSGTAHMLNSGKQSLIINMITFPFEDQNIGLESATSIVTGFTKSWSKELSPFNIRVGGVIPGISHTVDCDESEHWASIQDELIRSAEYIVSNEYFNGRIMAAEA